MSADVTAALAAVTGALPAAEERPGQRQMAQAVASSIDSGRHLVVQAGTGTGKTLGYLVPAIVAGKRVVVATATKALQDQLAAKDLPFLEAHLGIPFDWAVLKGRSNYVCMQRVREIQGADSGQLELEEFAATTKVEINRLVAWSGTTDTGDQAGLDWAPSDRAWQAVSVGSDECPGATRCPMGSVCFAEAARTRASVADVVVVNMHLYGLHVGSGGMLLPEHDVVVMDEAHQLEDIMSDTVGVQVAGGRFTTLTAALKRIIDDPQLVGGVAEASLVVRDALVPFLGQRLPRPFPAPVQEMLVDVRGRVQRALTALGAIDSDVEDAKARKMRGQQLATRLQDSIDLALDNREG
ncbi:MAG: ATP-dependent DNA helicase, partial [Ilumatobacteraceae bacterium]|nr:ATP-dependent DNA helicase [Ilumatobacteraceae bacterium]